MLESPLIDEIVAERTRETGHQYILTVLETRFGEIPQDVKEAITSVSDDAQLRNLVREAAACPDLDAFRTRIANK
jgi:hypothetical protein